MDVIGRAFSDYVNFLSYEPTRWQFVLSALFLAFVMFSLTRKKVALPGVEFFKFLFPKDIYFHRSTRTDFLYLLALPIIATFVFLPAISLLLTLAHHSHTATEYILVFFWGEPSLTAPASQVTQTLYLIIFTILFAMAVDFGFYLHHLAFHKIPFLWEFHKIHHSAEVLSPLTDFRTHPVELLSYGIATGATLGFAQGLFTYWTSSQLDVVTIWGLNAVFFAYNLLGYALRHSHIWISYGPVLSKVFISPAQHQIHHSEARQHWDRNFGGAFALWDWMFGTLYVPKEKEDLKFGIGQETSRYQNVKNLYLLPFKQNFARSRGSATVTVCFVAFVFISAIYAFANFAITN